MSSRVTAYKLSLYETLFSVDTKGKSEVFVVKNNQSNKLYIRKNLKTYDVEVFKAIKNIKNKHIAKIYEILQAEELLIIIEEYISGQTLKELLNENTILSEEVIIKYMINLCDALNELHKLNPPIIHRDIKTSNIIINNDGVLKLIDFDVSRVYKDSGNRDTEVLGTENYAAPEQFGFAQTDGRSDIYSMGVLMNVLSTGEIPRVLKNNTYLKKIIEKCIKMSPNERYQSVEELKKDLNEVNNRFNKDNKTNANESNINLVKKKLINRLSDKLKKEKLKSENSKNKKREKKEKEKLRIEQLRKEKLEKEESLLKEKKAKAEEKQQEKVKRNKSIKFDSTDSLNKEFENIKNNNKVFKIIPGFRSMKTWKIIISIALIYFPLGLAIAIGELALKEVALAFLMLWFLYTNFLNIKQKLPLINSRRPIMINIIGYILYTVIILFIGFIVLGVTLTTFGV